MQHMRASVAHLGALRASERARRVALVIASISFGWGGDREGGGGRGREGWGGRGRDGGRGVERRERDGRGGGIGRRGRGRRGRVSFFPARLDRTLGTSNIALRTEALARRTHPVLLAN